MNVTVPPHNNHKILWDSERSVCIKTPRKPWLSNWSIVDFRPISTCAIFSKNPGTPITYNINRSLRHATSHQISLSLKRRSYKWFKVQKKHGSSSVFCSPLIWQLFFAFSQISSSGFHVPQWHLGRLPDVMDAVATVASAESPSTVASVASPVSDAVSAARVLLCSSSILSVVS